MLRFIHCSLPRILNTRGASTVAAHSSPTSIIRSKEERIRTVWVSGFRLMLSLEERKTLFLGRIKDLSILVEKEKSEIGTKV
ncbi:hypothetical protein MTR_2g103070 [Medicago truncatula]|uniref:Uncharacterized protein n=1 Tax=Medicago truncatula TaxID=3880 RepID=G7IMG9_MEDTR|nr:hypothetical protein MTR_2g103070 [Medicago truncatula]